MSSTKKQDESYCYLFCNDDENSGGHCLISSSSSSTSVAPSTLSRFLQFHHQSNQINEEESPYQSLFANITYCQGCLVIIYRIKSLFEQLDQIQGQLIQLQQEVLQQLQSSSSSSNVTKKRSLSSSRLNKQTQLKQIILSELESSLAKSNKLNSSPITLIQFKKDPASAYVKLIRLEDDETVQNQFYYNGTSPECESLGIKQEPLETEQVDYHVEDLPTVYVFDPSDNDEPDHQDPEFPEPRDSDYEPMDTNDQEKSIDGRNRKPSRTTKNKKKGRRYYLCLYCRNLDPKDTSSFRLPENVWAHIKEKHESVLSTKQYDDQEEKNSSLKGVGYCSTSAGAKGKTFSCTFCPRSYGSHKTYLNHLVGQHTSQVSSILCLDDDNDDDDDAEETLVGLSTKSTNSKSKQKRHLLREKKQDPVKVKAKLLQLKLKPYQCQYCPKKFSSRANLQVHVRHLHTKMYVKSSRSGSASTLYKQLQSLCRYECKYCPDDDDVVGFFTSLRTLWRHLRVTHSVEAVVQNPNKNNNKKWSCAFCSSSTSFARSESCLTHVIMKHSHQFIKNNSSLLKFLNNPADAKEEDKLTCKFKDCEFVTKDLAGVVNTIHHQVEETQDDLVTEEFGTSADSVTYSQSRNNSIKNNTSIVKNLNNLDDDEEDEDRNNQLKCKFGGCEFKAPAKIDLVTHVKVIHVQQKQNNIYTKCGLQFLSTSSSSEQEEHNQSHSTSSKITNNKSKEIIPTDGGPKATIAPSDSKFCQYCSATYNSGSGRANHLRTVHPDVYLQSKTFNKELLTMTRFECKYCSSIFPKPRALWTHLKKTHSQLFNGSDICCSFCSASYTSSEGLIGHIISKHTHEHIANNSTLLELWEKEGGGGSDDEKAAKEETFCKICDSKFISSLLLREHVVRQHGESLPCPQCPLIFKSRLDLRRHQRDSHPAELLLQLQPTQNQCEICGRIFTSASDCKTHVKVVHNREGRYPCTFDPSSCSYKAYHKSRLRAHIKSAHTKLKDWLCNVCGKTFLKSDKYHIHVRTHTGEKPFACTICGKRFHSRQNYRRHEPLHGKERPFSCSLCELRFPTRNNLYGHLRSHHQTKGLGVGVKPTRKSKYNVVDVNHE